MALNPKEVLDRLRADPRLALLNAHIPPLRLFAALGVARDEVAHSRLLATLFDPRSHAGAETLLRALLSRVADGPNTPADTTTKIRSLPAKWTSLVARRELYRVDVIADIDAPAGLVVGIENKIDAGEGGDQLSRYQDFLLHRFPGRPAVMLFLTPSGRPPTTANDTHPVPCVPIGYTDVIEAIEPARRNATARDAGALELVTSHLREEIMGEPDEVRKLVRDLWRDYPDAIRLLVAHQPQLADIRKGYEDRIRSRFSKVEFYYYPQRGELQEIQFYVPDWGTRFPFCFMLRLGEQQLFARVLLYRDNFESGATRLKRWAANVNASKPGLIDEEFRAIPGWTVWRRVFKEEDWPAGSLVPVAGSDDETARLAAERILALIERLKPHVP